MKSVKLILSITLIAVLLFTVRCSKKSEPAPALVTISGKVTYTDASGNAANAAGAVVYLAKSAAATSTFDYNTVAGADGTYSFANLAAGSYYLNSVYNSDNTNTSGRFTGVRFTTASGYLLTATDVNLSQDVALVSTGLSTAEAVVATYSWDVGQQKYVVDAANYTFDNIHSPVQFEFPYRDNQADFKGSFIQTSALSINFDPANLGASSITATMDLLSVNTGTPGGRDALLDATNTPAGVFQPASAFAKGKLGCIAGTFAIVADDATATPNVVTTDADRYATFTSTSIKVYGDGYAATGNLTFHMATVPVVLYFRPVPASVDTSVSPNKKYISFEGKMSIKAKTDFGIVSSSVADDMNIFITVNLNKSL